MKLKLDADGHVVVQDGKPVYVHDDGKEVAFDAPGAMAKIGELNGEARSHREAKERAETALKGFEGLDAAEARKALQTVKNLDDKKLVDAGEVERVKEEAIKAVRAEFEPVVKERDTLKGQLDDAVIGGAFSRSKFITDKVAVPLPMLQKTYGEHFKVQDGKLIARDAAGKEIFSRTRPGELADFDEAIEHIITADPFKDHILKGDVKPGGGAGQSGAGGGGGKTLTRAAFDALSPAERASKMSEGFKITE